MIIPPVQTLDSVRTSSREFKCVLMMTLLGGGGQVCCCYSLPVEIFTIIILDIPEEITASGSCCLLSTVLIDIVHLTLCTTDYCNIINYNMSLFRFTLLITSIILKLNKSLLILDMVCLEACAFQT